MTIDFTELARNQFRRYYQPTRITLGVVQDTRTLNFNLITLCFTSSCSYKPPMVMLAVRRTALSYELFQEARQCVLAVPGEKIADQTLFCGTQSGREVNKVKECGFTLIPSQTVAIPGIAEAIANLEIQIENRLITGDHLSVFGRVTRFAVNKANKQRNLVSVGPCHEGYRVLAAKGIHRIGVVEPITSPDRMP